MLIMFISVLNTLSVTLVVHPVQCVSGLWKQQNMFYHASSHISKYEAKLKSLAMHMHHMV